MCDDADAMRQRIEAVLGPTFPALATFLAHGAAWREEPYEDRARPRA